MGSLYVTLVSHACYKGSINDPGDGANGINREVRRHFAGVANALDLKWNWKHTVTADSSDFPLQVY